MLNANSPEGKAAEAERQVATTADSYGQPVSRAVRGVGARQAERAAREAEKKRQEFLLGPIEQARTAFERGDLLFQVAFDVEHQKQNPLVVEFVNGSPKRTGDLNEILNAVAQLGWRLLAASFVFREQSAQGGDYSAMQSGHRSSGTTMGYYVFERRVSLQAANGRRAQG